MAVNGYETLSLVTDDFEHMRIGDKPGKDIGERTTVGPLHGGKANAQTEDRLHTARLQGREGRNDVEMADAGFMG
jgi:hypothetical protein